MDRYRQLDRDLAQKPYPAAGQDGLPAGAFQLASPAAGRGRLPAGAFQLVSPAAGWGRLPAGAFQLASRGAKGCLGGQRETWRAKCPPNLLIFWSRGREFWGGRRTHGRKQESVSAGSCLIGGRRTGRRKKHPPNKPWQARAADARRTLGRFVRPGWRREPGLANNRRDFGRFVRQGCCRRPQAVAAGPGIEILRQIPLLCIIN